MCGSCAARNEACHYVAEPDTSPINSLKRSYDALQEKIEEHEGFLKLLQDLPEADALSALQRLRSGEDVASLMLSNQDTQMVDGVEDGTDSGANEKRPSMADDTPSSSSLSQERGLGGKRREARDGV